MVWKPHWNDSGPKEHWANDLRKLVCAPLPNLMRLTKEEICLLVEALKEKA